jgi:hypothetical protein
MEVSSERFSLTPALSRREREKPSSDFRSSKSCQQAADNEMSCQKRRHGTFEQHKNRHSLRELEPHPKRKRASFKIRTGTILTSAFLLGHSPDVQELVT